MPIYIGLIILEVYFNQQLESLKSDQKCASYGQNTTNGRNRKTEHFLYRDCCQENDQNVGFSAFVSIFSHPIQLYNPFTLQNHFIFILTSLFYTIHLSLHVYLQKLFLNYFQTTQIWVITHTQRFVRVCSKP